MEPWHADARCIGLGEEDGVDLAFLFFGDADVDLAPVTQMRYAQAICDRCDVQVECLAYAYEARVEFGVWGGLTESQRKRYLYPAVRSHGLSFETLSDVIAKVRRAGTRHKRYSDLGRAIRDSEPPPMSRPA